MPRLEPAPCAFVDVPADWALQQRIDCGWLHVRESRGKQDSRTLKLWVAIARADVVGNSDAPLLYLHGGPGYATVDYFFPYFPKSKTWPALRKTRDLVFLGQRGTGRSQPGFCPELKRTFESIQVQSPPPHEALQRRRAAYAACRPKMLSQGFDFGAYNSSATVEDAEDLRRALDVRQWNLYGISYGTLVGRAGIRAACERRSSIRCTHPTRRMVRSRSPAPRSPFTPCNAAAIAMPPAVHAFPTSLAVCSWQPRDSTRRHSRSLKADGSPAPSCCLRSG